MSTNYADVPFDDDDEADSAYAQEQVEVTKRRELKVSEDAMSAADKIRQEPNIVKRARALHKAGYIQFPDVKKVRSGDTFIVQAKLTDTNKFHFFDILFENVDNKPHLDEYCGRIVDHERNAIDDKYNVREWIEACNAAQMREVTAVEIRKSLREWALQHRWNDLVNRIEENMQEWDGKPRMREFLTNYFKCFDTELNREFSQYFWLSLYMRLMSPGEQAPIVLSLFGVQNCGKSYFGKLITEIITGDEDADSVLLNLDGDKREFLRQITGQSIVASVGEMTGFTRGDLNKIKDFITRTHDKFDYKFEGHIHQPRQWITIMDGNKYEGMQRDDTGNRRFYPVFCGQTPDMLGKPAWREDFRVDFSNFEADLWQILAEAQVWLEENGVRGYGEYVRSVATQVFEFSKNEMARDRGTIHDEVFDTYLVYILKRCPKVLWRSKDGKRTGVGVKGGEFKRFFMDELKGAKPIWKHLRNKMMSLGAIEFTFSGGYPGYLFEGFETFEAFDAGVGVVSDFVSEGDIIESREGAQNNSGGF